MRFNGHWITVGDVIDQLANVQGAVHKGEPGTARRQAVQALGSSTAAMVCPVWSGRSN